MILYRKGLYAQAMQVLGIEALRPWQEPVFQSILNFNDVLYIAPTGQGKSVLFQLPAVMEAGEHLTVVISPMLALQYDQVKKLLSKGGDCLCPELGSDVCKAPQDTERAAAYDAALSGTRAAVS